MRGVSRHAPPAVEEAGDPARLLRRLSEQLDFVGTNRGSSPRRDQRRRGWGQDDPAVTLADEEEGAIGSPVFHGDAFLSKYHDQVDEDDDAVIRLPHPPQFVESSASLVVNAQLQASQEQIKSLESRLQATEKERDEALSETRRAVQAYRRLQNRVRDLEAATAEQADQLWRQHEQDLVEMQVAFEAERAQMARDKVDMQRMYEDEIASVRQAAEQWAVDVEEQYKGQVLAMEQEHQELAEAYRKLEKELKMSETERGRLSKRFREKVREMELLMHELKEDFHEKLRRERETRSAMSRRRVSQALDEIKL